MSAAPARIKPIFVYVITIALAVGVILAALCLGRFPISFGEVLSLFGEKLFDRTPGTPSTAQIVLFDIRGPRVIAAFVVGGALAAAGAAYQNLFRNPLVSPDILGVSGGAALGAMLGIFFALPMLAIQGMAFAGGLLAVTAIYLIGRHIKGHDPLMTLVLTGVVTGSLFGAGVALTKYLADPYNQLPAMTYWLLGSFAGVTNGDLAVVIPLMLVSLAPLWLLRWRINLLSLPDDEARALGLNIQPLRLAVIVAATLMTATAVAICGMIGWVGLVVPHAVRLLTGAEFSRLLPLAVLLGGTFMVAIDTIGRSIAQIEVPPGVLTAAIGTPVFIWLMHMTYRRRP